MKKIELGQTFTILANVGVIAGILFLAFELRQNNELIRAEARNTQNERIEDFVQQVYTVPGLAEIVLKIREGEPLTEVEEIKLRGRQGRQLRGFFAQWREYTEGAGEAPNLEVWRSFFYEGGYYTPPLISGWEDIKTTLPPDFIRHVEENVLNR